MTNETENESGLMQHAKREFKAAGWVDENGDFKDEMQKTICRRVLTLLEVFSEQGHPHSTVPYAIDLFTKLAGYRLLSPLTGDDDEWNEVREGVFQNKRCSHVFKQADRFDGQAYDIDAIVFLDWGVDEDTGERRFKSFFTNGGSHQPIEFPYRPKKKYQEVK